MKIDHYLNIYAKKKIGTTTLKDIFSRIKTEHISTPKNKRQANVFSSRSKKGRRHPDLTGYTGLMFMDLDECTDHKKVKEFFISLEHTVATWYSSSGVNVHALIKIPKSTSIKQYRRRFEAFIFLIKPHMKEIASIDKITINPTQLAYESYDPDIYINDAPVSFTLMMPKPKKIVAAPVVVSNHSDKRTEWVIKKIDERIRTIKAPGYTQLLAYSKTLGGWVSGGYIGKDVAEAHLLKAISENDYFNSKDSSGTIKTYMKGGLGAFEHGLLYPLEWKKYH